MDSARTDSPDDLALVAAVRAGDDRAFEVLYGRYRSRITGYVQGMVGDWARAEDVTQEVFISAVRRMRATTKPIVFRPWIFEIAKNACIDQFRRSKRAEEVPWETDDGDGVRAIDGGQTGATPRTPESAAESSEQLEHLRGAFGALSESHHEILVLRELEGLSYREIGERMGLSRPGVESTLFRARRRLSEEYDDLTTGRSCERLQTVLVAAEHGSLGVREHRRLARHVSWCRPCRREARLAGVEGLAPAGVAARIAAFLPLPVVDLLRRLRGGGGGGAGGVVASAAQGMDSMAPGWTKAAMVVAALATAGAGAGVVHEVASAGAPASPAVSASHGAAGAPAAQRVTGTTASPSPAAGAAGGSVLAERGRAKGSRHAGPVSAASSSSRIRRPADALPGSSSARARVAPRHATTPSLVSPPSVASPPVSPPGIPVAPVTVPGLPSVKVPPLPARDGEDVKHGVGDVVDGVGGAVQGTTGGPLGHGGG